MIEFFVLYWMINRIGEIVEGRRLKSRFYKIASVALWFGGEIAGALIGARTILGKSPVGFGTGKALVFQGISIYLYALVVAALGAWVAFYIAKNFPRTGEQRVFKKNAVMKKLLKNPLSMLGLILLLFFVVVAVFAPWIAPTEEQYKDEPYRIPRYGWEAMPTPPSAEHPMGLAEGQYDIYYGLIWGTRTAFRVGIIVVVCTCFIGVAIGSISAYIGGMFDEIVMRITDIFMSFPRLLAIIVVTAILGKGLDKVMISMILFGWTAYARLIRGSIFQAKEEDYVKAARAAGVSHTRILTRHLLPNTIFPTIIQASMNLGSLVITASSLSFLGLGAPVGYADWGQMISFARNWMLGTQGNALAYWYTVVYPGGAIVLFVLSWNLIGDAFRDIMDPKVQA